MIVKPISTLILAPILLWPLLAFPADPLTNETLFEQCKVYKNSKPDGNGMTDAERLDAIACLSYMAGAFQMHNWANGGHCHSGKTVNSFIDDYMAFTRKGGFLQQRPDLVVFMMMESCYCGREPAVRYFCPLETDPKYPH